MSTPRAALFRPATSGQTCEQASKAAEFCRLQHAGGVSRAGQATWPRGSSPVRVFVRALAGCAAASLRQVVNKRAAAPPAAVQGVAAEVGQGSGISPSPGHPRTRGWAPNGAWQVAGRRADHPSHKTAVRRCSCHSHTLHSHTSAPFHGPLAPQRPRPPQPCGLRRPPAHSEAHTAPPYANDEY